jgi:hypothetical protein
MEEYALALDSYNSLIAYAESNQDMFSDAVKSLYVERGWAKKRMGDEYGANFDFVESGIEQSKLDDYEPKFANQQFVSEF